MSDGNERFASLEDEVTFIAEKLSEETRDLRIRQEEELAELRNHYAGKIKDAKWRWSQDDYPSMQQQDKKPENEAKSSVTNSSRHAEGRGASILLLLALIFGAISIFLNVVYFELSTSLLFLLLFLIVLVLLLLVWDRWT